MRFLMFSAALGLVAVAHPTAAQDAGIEVTDAALAAAVDEAEALGRLLWLYDQAAWHATDALFAKTDPAKIDNPRGYVVIPREGDDMLDTIFVVERDGELREFARYTVNVDSVVGGGLVEGPLPSLSSLAARMFAARSAGLEAMQAEGFGLCSRTNPNTLTLPPDGNGNIAFYLLTSTEDAEIYPMGGHYRADIAPDGSVVSTTRYMNTCFDLPTAAPIGQEGQAGHAGVSYLFGDTPTEIHVFVGYQMPSGYMVITSQNRKLWLIEDGIVTLQQSDFDPPEM